MKEVVIHSILQRMEPFLDNSKLKQLDLVLEQVLKNCTIDSTTSTDQRLSDEQLVEKFLSAKAIEGCSPKTINYYKQTINNMYKYIDKSFVCISTDDLRHYLIEYQINGNLSRVTVDSVRRSLVGFCGLVEVEV